MPLTSTSLMTWFVAKLKFVLDLYLFKVRMCEVALGEENISPHSAARLLLLADRHNLVELEKVGTSIHQLQNRMSSSVIIL